MANEEHLARLKQGVGDWNGWRVSNLGVQPDLCDADLRRADLYGAILTDGSRTCYLRILFWGFPQAV
jgi:hypothetical protein